MLKTNYANTNGLVKGIKFALQRQGLEVSKEYKGKINWRSTHGVEVSNYYDEVRIELNNWKYDTNPITMEQVANALVAEGVAVEDIEIGVDAFGKEQMLVNAKPYVQKFI